MNIEKFRPIKYFCVGGKSQTDSRLYNSFKYKQVEKMGVSNICHKKKSRLALDQNRTRTLLAPYPNA